MSRRSSIGAGIGLGNIMGNIMAVVLSWTVNHSILWVLDNSERGSFYD